MRNVALGIAGFAAMFCTSTGVYLISVGKVELGVLNLGLGLLNVFNFETVRRDS